ncbi:transposon conjugation system subunit ConG [Bacillus subtilis]|uniref:transposon conjugation system subunit ConG n=1 Tax=Bacillus subtilis TaxID=1423 RepID=UPI000B3E4F03|nr:transposon conjugation system subunit ConG [Bacillus subtilis]QHF56383.1 membrane protein [Bacillus subtilis]
MAVMKKKRILIVSAIVLLFLTVASAVTVFSADGDTTTQPKIEKAGGVELKVKRFPISRYQANNEASDDLIKGAFVGLTNVTFSFAGNIVRVVDAGMDILYNLQPIDEFANSITNVSKTVYKTLKKNFGEALFIFTCAYVVYLFCVRGSVKEAMRRSILFICVMVIGGLWMSNAGYYMKALNALSVEAQGKLLTAGNGLVGIVQDEGNFADSSAIEKGKEMEGTVAVMRNLYFDIALMKPFLIVNFDETSEKKINEKDTDKGGLNRIDKLLSYKLSEDGEKDKKDYIKETEIDEYKNESMTSGNVFNQLGESFIAVVASIVIGIPFLALAFFNFLLQVVALVIVFFVPFAFILAYVPQLAYSGFVTLGRLGSVYLLKAMLGIIVLFVYVTCFIVDKLIPPNGYGMYLLNVAVLASILWIGFHKRDAIIKFVTAGKVVSVDNNMMENMRQNIVQPAWEQAKKIGGVWGNGGGVFTDFTKHFGGRKDGSNADGVTGAPSGGGNSPSGAAMGYDNTHAISRTPQKETANGIANHNSRSLKRNPQTLSKEQQKQKEAFANAKENKQQSHLDRLRKDGINSPMLKDALNAGNEDLPKRAPILQDKKDESARTDQKEYVEQLLKQPDNQQQTDDASLQLEEETISNRAPVLQENEKDTERTDQKAYVYEEQNQNPETDQQQDFEVQKDDSVSKSEPVAQDRSAEIKRSDQKVMTNHPDPQLGFESSQSTKVENQPIANNERKIRPSEPAKIHSDGIRVEEKQTIAPAESKTVSREKQPSAPSIKRTEQSVNTFEQISLNEIARRSSSKVEDRLRRDERTK